MAAFFCPLGGHCREVHLYLETFGRWVPLNVVHPGGGTLEISGWGCAAGTLEPLTYTRASSAEFCHPILE